LNILFITHEYPSVVKKHGGIGTFVQTLARSMVSSSHNVFVLGIGQEFLYRESIDLGVKVMMLPTSNWKFGSFIQNFFRLNYKIYQINKMHNLNIVEGSELSLSFILKFQGIKYTIRLHGGHHFFSKFENRKLNKWKAFQEKRSFKNADAFISVSNFTQLETLKSLGFFNKKIIKINNPINTNFFLPLKNENSEDIKKIVFVGTICQKKGVVELIKSIKVVTKKHLNVKLFLYGRDWFFNDGTSYIEYLNKLFDKSHLEFVDFCGVVNHNDLPKIYSSADVCVFPSHMETQGLVALEAMSTGRPVIFTKLGPGPETIRHGVTGLLCDPHDPEDIANHIIWVLENPNEAAILGDNGRKYIVDNYSLEKVLNENLKFYKSIL
jgi:glycosyltransferase involved in cell wall biosynthesis